MREFPRGLESEVPKLYVVCYFKTFAEPKTAIYLDVLRLCWKGIREG